MAEPQPADVDPPQPPRGQQAAESAALSNLSTTDISADDNSAASTSKNENDIAALNNAISNLTVNNAASSGPAKTTDTAKAPSAKKVKIDANDVTWMVAELEVSKSAATAMLRAADGKRERAVEKFILPQPVNVASQA